MVPVTASNPTCTWCTKFVGLPIGEDSALRRYRASRHVYNSVLPLNSIETVSMGADPEEDEFGRVVN